MIIRYVKVLLLGLCISLYSLYSGVFGCSGPAADTETTFPETCAAVKANLEESGESHPNGTYTLYVNGDEAQPWDAYCHDMNRAEPKEYLTVDMDNNVSQISDGTNIASTSYRRLRIDPVRLELWPLDDTFATSDFDSFEPTLPDGLDSIPVGWAEFQYTVLLEAPVAAETNVDLTDTGFVLDESVLDNDMMDFFCSVASSEGAEEFSDGTGTEVAADLSSLALTATTTYSEIGTTIREVADCSNLGAEFDAEAAEVDTAVIPLEYVGE